MDVLMLYQQLVTTHPIFMEHLLKWKADLMHWQYLLKCEIVCLCDLMTQNSELMELCRLNLQFGTEKLIATVLNKLKGM
jgi:hypothetical protein